MNKTIFAAVLISGYFCQALGHWGWRFTYEKNDNGAICWYNNKREFPFEEEMIISIDNGVKEYHRLWEGSKDCSDVCTVFWKSPNNPDTNITVYRVPDEKGTRWQELSLDCLKWVIRDQAVLDLGKAPTKHCKAKTSSGNLVNTLVASYYKHRVHGKHLFNSFTVEYTDHKWYIPIDVHNQCRLNGTYIGPGFDGYNYDQTCYYRLC